MTTGTAGRRPGPGWAVGASGRHQVHDGTGRRPSILDSYEPYLRERWNSGATNATVLWHEIRARGYPGGYSRVRDYLQRFRQTACIPAPASRPPKPRRAASWIMTRPGTLTTQDQASLDAILAASPELSTLTGHVRAFATLMTERRGRDLERCMTAAAASGEPALQSFVTGLRADQDAVTAGSPFSGAQAAWKVTSTASRCSNARCTDGQTTTCSVAVSSSPTDLTKTVPEPDFACR